MALGRVRVAAPTFHADSTTLRTGLAAMHAEAATDRASPALMSVAARPTLGINAKPTLRRIQPFQVGEIKYISPKIGAAISAIGRDRAEGVERSAAGAPISPTDRPTDQTLFEDPADASKRFYIAQYRLKQLGGKYLASLKPPPSGDGAVLEIRLEKRAAAGLGALPPGTQEIPPKLSAIVRYTVAIAGGGRQQKELAFGEIEFPEGDVVCRLRVETLPGRDELYRAIADPASGAAVIIRRAVRVAIPLQPKLNQAAVTDLRLRMLRGAPATIQPSTAAATIVPVDHAGTAAHLRGGMRAHLATGLVRDRVVLAEPTRYRVTDIVLDDTIGVGDHDGSTFTFDPALHPYVFTGITPGARPAAVALERIAFNNQQHVYVPDTTDPALFYYLPDCLKLGRLPDGACAPMALLRLVVDPAVDTQMLGVMSLVLLPFADDDRLSDAQQKLQLAASTRSPGAQGIRLEPLNLAPASLRLSLRVPSTDGVGTEIIQPEGLSLDLRLGASFSIRFRESAAQRVFDAMCSGGAEMLLTGTLEIRLGERDADVWTIAASARFGDTTGDVFSIEERPEAGAARIGVTLTNAIESPVSPKGIEASLLLRDAAGAESLVPGTIDTAGAPWGAELKPGESLSFAVVPAAPTPEGAVAVDAIFDFDRVRVLPDKDAIMAIVLSQDVPTPTTRLISVRVVPDAFAPLGLPTPRAVVAIIVEFKANAGSGSAKRAKLTHDAPELQVELSKPPDEIVSGQDSGLYEYRVQTEYDDGGIAGGPWIKTDETLLLVKPTA